MRTRENISINRPDIQNSHRIFAKLSMVRTSLLEQKNNRTISPVTASDIFNTNEAVSESALKIVDTLTESQKMHLIRQTRRLTRRSLGRPALNLLNEHTGLTSQMIKKSKRALSKEVASTLVATVGSEAPSYLSGWASAMIDVQNKFPIKNPLVIAGITAASYGAVWGSLWLNEKANAALLKAKGIGTDPMSKIASETASNETEERKRSRIGYWAWHGSTEGVYVATAVGIGMTSGWAESAAFQVVANTVGAVKLLAQAAIVGGIALKENRKVKKNSKNKISVNNQVPVSTEAVEVFGK